MRIRRLVILPWRGPTCVVSQADSRGGGLGSPAQVHHLRPGSVATRNGALHDLTKEIDAASLADLLGYTPKTMNIHAARAAVPMATYPAINRPETLKRLPGLKEQKLQATILELPQRHQSAR